MAHRSSQGGLSRLARLSVVAAIVAGCLAGIGCESPARVKPWRHAEDPLAVAAARPGQTRAVAPSSVLAGRSHTLRVALGAEPRGLNPLLDLSLWTQRAMVGTVFETLVNVRPQAGSEPARYAPGLARAWRIGANGQELLFELHPNARWHDGRGVFSVDVQFTLDLVRSPRGPSPEYRALLRDVEAVELVGPRSVRIRLARNNGWVLRALAAVPILPAHVYQPSLAAGGALVGSGPYRFSSRQAGVIKLTANEASHLGRPAIADVELVYNSDAAAVLTAAKRGEIDIVPELIPAHWPQQASAPGFSQFAPLELRPPRLRAMLFDTRSPPLDDVRVRRALSLLVDRRSLAKDVWGGLATPVGGASWPGGPIDAPAAEIPPFDPQAAGRLLDEAGWRDVDGDGVREQGGQPIRLEVLVATSATAGRASVHDRVLAAFRRAGIGVDVRAGSPAVIENRLQAGEFDLAFVELAGMADMDTSSWFAAQGALNAAGLTDPAVEQALTALTAVWEPEQRRARAPALTAALEAALPFAAIVADAPQGLVHRRVLGLEVWNGWIDLSRLSFAQ